MSKEILGYIVLALLYFPFKYLIIPSEITIDGLINPMGVLQAGAGWGISYFLVTCYGWLQK